MEIRDHNDTVIEWFIYSFIFIIFLPFLLIFLIYKLIMTPFDYIKYKRSRYQQDFPKKYKWLSTPHIDNKPYTAIKENDLPVEYIKWREEYDLNGYFVYKDVLLDFNEPFFFDKDKGIWLSEWCDNDSDEETADDGKNEKNIDCENTDNCQTVEETIKFLLEDFKNNMSGRECKRVVFFYEQKRVEKIGKEDGLEKMRDLDDFIIYEKSELARAIKEFIEKCESLS